MSLRVAATSLIPRPVTKPKHDVTPTPRARGPLSKTATVQKLSNTTRKDLNRTALARINTLTPSPAPRGQDALAKDIPDLVQTENTLQPAERLRAVRVVAQWRKFVSQQRKQRMADKLYHRVSHWVHVHYIVVVVFNSPCLA